MDKSVILFSIQEDELNHLLECAVRKVLNEAGMTTKSQPEADLVNIQKAAEILALSVQTIYRLTSTRKLNHYKKGKILYFSKKELVDWIKSGRKKTQVELYG